jgi:hypothetical protein
LFAWSAYAGHVNIVVNGREIETSVIESNGAIYVPIETLGKALGATVIVRSNEVAAATAVVPVAPPATPAPPVITEPPRPAHVLPPPMTTVLLSTPPTPRPAVDSIKGVLHYKVNILDSRGIDAGAQVWLVPAEHVGALASAAGGTADEPISQRAVGWDTKLSGEFKFPRAVANERGEFSFANVPPGGYTLILLSKHTNGLAARDRRGKVRFRKITVSEGQTVDMSFSFGMSALPVEDDAAPSPHQGSGL